MRLISAKFNRSRFRPPVRPSPRSASPSVRAGTLHYIPSGMPAFLARRERSIIYSAFSISALLNYHFLFHRLIFENALLFANRKPARPPRPVAAPNPIILFDFESLERQMRTFGPLCRRHSRLVCARTLREPKQKTPPNRSGAVIRSYQFNKV